MQLPSRGDLVASGSVALILVPQSMAYAQLAGLPPQQGLYAAAVAPALAAIAGSSPYLQTGPAAMTSLLTLGALAPLAPVGSGELVGLAALLALVVGVVRVLLGLLRAGLFAYLLSEPAINGFTLAGALLIVGSQLPALLDVPSGSSNPAVAGGQALSDPRAWEPAAVVLGLVTIAVVLAGRRIGPLFPAVPLVTAVGLLVALQTDYAGALVGAVPEGLPRLSLDLPWSDLPALLVPGVVIAVVGFAEAVSISRRYAVEERQPWDADRELRGQGLANLGAGLVSGYPTGGSLSRSALNKAAGANSRWSGVLTGAIVVAALPFAGVLSSLPKAVLAGLVVATTLGLLDLAGVRRPWELSRLQGLVALATFAATLAFAPRVERGVLVGVGLAVAVHLWRETRLEVPHSLDGQTLHVRPEGVLFYGSAGVLQDRVDALLAEHPEVDRVVLHLRGLGRVDLSGMLAIRDLLLHAGVPVLVTDVPGHSRRLVARVLMPEWVED